MNIPEELKYTEDHEWIRLESDNTAYIGITDYAQDQLGDIVFVEIETVGQELEKHAIFGTIEAVKTVSDLYLPVTGKIVELNEALGNEPETVNKDPYGKGWLIKMSVSNPDELNDLLDAQQYKSFVNV